MPPSASRDSATVRENSLQVQNQPPFADDDMVGRSGWKSYSLKPETGLFFYFYCWRNGAVVRTLADSRKNTLDGQFCFLMPKAKGDSHRR
jgi:hypothetical protein